MLCGSFLANTLSACKPRQPAGSQHLVEAGDPVANLWVWKRLHARQPGGRQGQAGAGRDSSPPPHYNNSGSQRHAGRQLGAAEASAGQGRAHTWNQWGWGWAVKLIAVSARSLPGGVSHCREGSRQGEAK